jgi:purine-binding chemotaxis protein CheW
LHLKRQIGKGITLGAPLLTFRLQGACFAVEAACVREILRLPALTPVAEAAHYIIGVVNYRGHILPVMDLSLRLGLPRYPYQIHDHIIVLEQEGQPLLGVHVNEVLGVHDIPLEHHDVQAALPRSNDGGPRFVRHLAKLDATAIMILDHDLLLSTAGEHRTTDTQAALSVPAVIWQQSPEHPSAHDSLSTQSLDTIPLFFPHAAPWERELLCERARNLTNDLAEQSATRHIVLAIIGLSGEYFGVELETVREFTNLQQITPVPCCPAYIVGDMNLRGDILTVVDIRKVLQMPVGEITPTAKVMVVPLGETVVGVLVDQVVAVLDINFSDLCPLPVGLKATKDSYLKGGVPYQEKILAILDIPTILTSGGLTVNEEE